MDELERTRVRHLRVGEAPGIEAEHANIGEIRKERQVGNRAELLVEIGHRDEIGPPKELGAERLEEPSRNGGTLFRHAGATRRIPFSTNQTAEPQPIWKWWVSAGPRGIIAAFDPEVVVKPDNAAECGDPPDRGLLPFGGCHE